MRSVKCIPVWAIKLGQARYCTNSSQTHGRIEEPIFEELGSISAADNTENLENIDSVCVCLFVCVWTHTLGGK